MDHLVYGPSEPSYYVNRVRHTPLYNFEAGSVNPMSAYGYNGRALAAVELLVPMCCQKCEEKVYENMMELRGVQGVMVDLQAQRVIVHGLVDSMKALKAVKKVKKDSQLWSGAQYAGLAAAERDYFSSPKYRRSAYRSPSLYRTSSYQYRPPVNRSSYNRHTPSYGQSYIARQPWPVYDDLYSHVITNPYYIQSEYY